MAEPKDHWSSEAYRNAAGFVPQLTKTVISYLDAQPNDLILDLGCGDGLLTAQIASCLTGAGQIHGLDASQSFIASAKRDHQPSNCFYALRDCTALNVPPAYYDKVFSNAALHWILRSESTRTRVLLDVYKALKSGGKFVFEMGGKGNVAEIHAAFNAALLSHGVDLATIQKVNPWFFPSTEWMSKSLEEVGFRVEICELEYRPTKTLAATEQNGQGSGLTGWLKLMGAQFLNAVPSTQHDSVIKFVNDILQNVITREEDGSQWIGYVRLRAVATKA